VKIVSLSPSLTDILVALKGEDCLVGVSDACEINGRPLGRIGPPKAVQMQRLQSLSPDWILGDSQDNRPEELESIQKRWKTKVFAVRKMENVYDTIAELGRLTAKQNEARNLNQTIQQEVSSNEDFFRNRAKKRTVLLVWDTPYLTVNFDTYPSHLLEASGGVNVFREEPLREFPVEMEDMIEREPQLLLLSGDPAPFKKRHIAQFRRYRIFSGIPIYIIEGKFLSLYGARTFEALRRLRKIYQE